MGDGNQPSLKLAALITVFSWIDTGLMYKNEFTVGSDPSKV